jgi:hypothetical protein
VSSAKLPTRASGTGLLVARVGELCWRLDLVFTSDTDVTWVLGGPCANEKREAAVRDLEVLEALDLSSGATLDTQPLTCPASENFELVDLNFEVKLTKNSVDSVSINMASQRDVLHRQLSFLVFDTWFLASDSRCCDQISCIVDGILK